MDEISQGPEPNFHVPRGRWLDVAVAVILIAAAALAVVPGRGSLPPRLPQTHPARRRLRLCCHPPRGHGSDCRSANRAA